MRLNVPHSCTHRSRTVVLAVVAMIAVSQVMAETQPDEAVFEQHVRPIFEKHCFRCHGARRKAELDLRTRQSILEGSESGSILSADIPQQSLLYEVIHEGRMPPEEEQPLSQLEQQTVLRWIMSGAAFRATDTSNTVQLHQHVVLPILQLRCTVCHGRQKQEAELDLRTRASILRGGASGPAMIPGDPANSLILRRIHAEEMPPRDRLAAASVKPMEEAEIALLTAWIADDAPETDIAPDIADGRPDPLVSVEDRDFWSFQPPRPLDVPAVSGDLDNPVDAFILRKLKANGLSFSPEADRATLIRRATLDLTGLPPTPEEIDSFLADTEPDAWPRLVDRLLDSPRYGERWGRYWLDLAGYADSEGGQHADQIRPEAYRYRDYVIRSLNADKPYDRFLLEQIAGDELVDYRGAENITEEIYENLVATGFLRMAPDGTYAGITAFVPDRLEIIDDEIEVLSSAVMGLTVRCARCHSHKFDPIPQRDYYRLAAVFKGAFDEHDWLEPTKHRYLTHVTSKERRAWKSRDDRLLGEIESIRNTLAERQTEFAARHTPASPTLDELKKLEPDFAKAAEQADEAIKAIEQQRVPEPRIRALWDRGQPSPTYLLRRGSYLTPGRLIGPGVPSVLTDGVTPFEVEPPFAGTTGRRLAFARWLTSPDHPLTARVMVNRIWKHHFGTGIVSTLDNFGITGARPTHPELLDWLAVRFVRSDWSIKTMHRLIMNSVAWRQSSDVTAQHRELDPDNKLLSRMPMKRMEGEVLRDSLLSISGRLDLTPFGPADEVQARDDGLVVSVGKEDRWRRTIYVLQRRTAHLTILDNFDLPQLNPNCIERSDSIVAPQALHLLNNHRIHQLSRFFAARIRKEVGDDPAAQIRRAWLVACGRSPTKDEQQITRNAFEALQAEWMQKLSRASPADSAAAHTEGQETDPELAAATHESAPLTDRTEPEMLLQQSAQRAFENICHAIMNSADFLYID